MEEHAMRTLEVQGGSGTHTGYASTTELQRYVTITQSPGRAAGQGVSASRELTRHHHQDIDSSRLTRLELWLMPIRTRYAHSTAYATKLNHAAAELKIAGGARGGGPSSEECGT